MKPNDRGTLIRAAEMLEADAECIYASSTVDGVWDDDADKTEHAELLDVSSALRVIAGPSLPSSVKP